MNKALIKHLILSSLIFFASYSYGQFKLSAEIRPRAEFRYGFKTLRASGDDPAFFVEQRSRLKAIYLSERFELNFTLQDVRIWGENSQIYKSDNGMTNLYEGWLKYSFSDHWSAKVGRQAIDLDNARFLGDLDWAQQGRSHDALVLIHKSNEKKFELQLGGAFNQNISEPTHLFGTEYLGLNNYKTMLYAWFHKDYTHSQFSILAHSDGRQVVSDTSMAFRQTFGAIGEKRMNKVHLDGEFYYQGGRNPVDQKVSAYLVSLTVTYKTAVSPLSLGFDYLSGTDIQDTEDKSFEPLYGTNHKFYGFMDYFYVGNPHRQAGTSSGLLDIYLKSNFKLSEKSTLTAHLHHFSSASDIYDPEDVSKEISKNLGVEADLVFVHKFGGNAILNLGYSAMSPSESLEVIKGRGNHELLQHWAWAMLSFKPLLFSTDTKN